MKSSPCIRQYKDMEHANNAGKIRIRRIKKNTSKNKNGIILANCRL